MRKQESIHLNQKGSGHVLLVAIIFVAVAGVVGFVGYNAWQKQSSNAGGTATVGGAAKAVRGTEFNIFEANARVTGDGNVADAIKLPHYVPASSKQSTNWIKANDKRAWTSRVAIQYGLNGPSDKTKQNASFNKFIAANFGKKMNICVNARATSLKNEPLLGLYMWGDKNTAKEKRFNLTTKYKEYCMAVVINKAPLSATDDFLRFDVSDIGGHSFGTPSFALYVSRLKFTVI